MLIMSNTDCSYKILLQKREQTVLSLLLHTDKNRILAASVYDLSDPIPLGTIFIGRVSKIMNQIEGCFVGLPDGNTAFLPLHQNREHLIPLNRTPDERILEGDLLLLQVRKEAQKNKPIEVSPCPEIPGETVVVTLGTGRFRYSGKLSAEEKAKCKGLTDRITLPGTLDLTFRTASGTEDHEMICKEANEKIRILEDITTRRCHHAIAKEILYRDNDLISHIIRDLSSYRSAFGLRDEEIMILTEDQEMYQSLTEQKDLFSLEKISFTYHDDPRADLETLYGLKSKFSDLIHKKVYLRSGGSIVIEQTEALVSVDVNTGKNLKKQAPEEYFFTCNLEAADEILSQLRLRNLSGMIIIDFINMKDPANMQKLIKHIRERCRTTYRDTSFVDQTKLGLIELTKKKRGKPLSEQLRIWVKND